MGAIFNREQLTVLHSMQDFVGENLQFLAPVDKAWQPTDYLPDLSGEDWRDQVQAFRDPAQSISDELLVVLVGDMVTEEALPSYSVSLNNIVEDEHGDSPKPWAKWLRGWTAEENRHGDLLNAYLRLTGRVDMHAVELTVHYLIANGFNPATFPDPYNGLIYTSFQERATRISHGNVAKLVGQQGDANLAKICQRISGDESRHEAFYTRCFGNVLELDTETAIICVKDMLRTVIAMPGKLMYDGKDPDLFDHFAIIAQRTGVYTIHDYAAIIEHLVKTWNIAGRSVSGKAAKAQEYICRQSERYLRFADEMTAAVKKQKPIAFSWIHDRKI
ncbi:MAG TPA: acyl-ACP desaturase [Phycisphaerae bacterium]|jgi:acyl-[acyl-carrier-protein] desaturase